MLAIHSLPPHANGVTLTLAELLHYRTQSVHWLPPAQSIWSQMNGNHTGRQKGRGMDFMEVRQYQAGDDIRSIDWRVTARTGKAHTKLRGGGGVRRIRERNEVKRTKRSWRIGEGGRGCVGCGGMAV